jgi:putative DNA primase/helicase
MLNGMSHTQVAKHVLAVADSNPVNPARDWIMSKDWDGVDRVADICSTLTVRAGFPIEIKNVLVKKSLVSAVAAATMPHGFHCRGILTFSGPQGIGKTSWVRSLVPEGLLRDKFVLTGHLLDTSNKDSMLTALSKWLVEIGELDATFKKEFVRLKSFITADRDAIRRLYERSNSEYQRRTIFFATVNEENFLIDPSGNSRFWTLPVVHIDYAHNIDTQQLFRQLYHELQQGAKWWLTPEEEQQLTDLNQAHRAVSAIEERVLEEFDFDLAEDQWSTMSASGVLRYIGYRQPSSPQSRECGGVLRKHLGEPTSRTHGISKWKVPLPESSFPGLG